MSVTSPDFESGAYTNFATPAFGCDMIKPVPTQRKLPFREPAGLNLSSSSAGLLRPRFVQNLVLVCARFLFSLSNLLYSQHLALGVKTCLPLPMKIVRMP